jgi:hypothetical protein
MSCKFVYQRAPAQHPGDFEEASVCIEKANWCEQEADAKSGRRDDQRSRNCRYREHDPFQNTGFSNQSQVI